MSFQGGATFVFVNVKAGTAADLSGGNNKWALEDAGDGFFRIKNGSGKYLSVDGDVKNGAPVIGSNHQQTWKITPDDHHPNEQGYIRIFVPGTPFNLDLADFGNPTPGTHVQLWEKTPGKNQAWFFQSPQA